MVQTMVKRELVNTLVKAFPGISKQDMLTVVDAFFESMAQAMMEGQTIDLRGVGRFKIKERKPAKGRNPKTMTPVYLPKRWVVHFKPAESLSKRINKKSA
ncbi:MAG: integration host factor subunit beta [Deltaproteobacteria bacterium]|nr:integration host factor subunit beta [Deltaproteobacteria bacterium]